jgi:hypothetical protein
MAEKGILLTVHRQRELVDWIDFAGHSDRFDRLGQLDRFDLEHSGCYCVPAPCI